jgi:Ca2+:H+ antiporter
MQSLRDLLQFLRESWLNLLLVFVPVSLLLAGGRAPAAWVFATAALAIVPLAGLIGQATEATTEHTGPGLGGLLNATFGNATELIIALFAIRRGLYAVVKASITGSILGNVLLVLGLAMFAGGWKREKQAFSPAAASASVSMLTLAVTALVMPALWDMVAVGRIGVPNPTVQRLSLLTALVLLAVYVASLIFSLVTHRELLPRAAGAGELPRYRLPSAITLLGVATVLTALESELLVAAIQPAAEALGMTQFFIGIVVVAVVGNAAEHYTAVAVAIRGKMELAIRIALGSGTQIALFVGPALICASYLTGRPMDLVINPFELVALALAVMNVGIASRDGEANWFKGAQLVAVYLVLAFSFYFAPARPNAAFGGRGEIPRVGRP